jgi:hypothetical protein
MPNFALITHVASTAAAAAVLLSGCTTTEPDRNQPTNPSPTTSSQPLRGSAPPAPRALDLTVNRADPCVLLGEDDFKALGFTGKFAVVPGDPPGGTWGFCEVGGGQDGGRLELELHTDEPVLQTAYADTSDKFEVFEPTDVLSFPAVKRAYSVDVPSSCTVIVGAGDRQGVLLDYTASDLKGGTAAICAKTARHRGSSPAPPERLTTTPRLRTTTTARRPEAMPPTRTGTPSTGTPLSRGATRLRRR